MNKSYNDKTYCVYAYYVDNVCYYIGHGCKVLKRHKSKCGRSKEVLDLFLKDGFEIRILHENLPKVEAEELENSYLNLHYKNPSETFKLLNKVGARRVKEIHPEKFTDTIKVDEKSPSGLAWVRPEERKTKFPGHLSKSDGYWYLSLGGVSYKVHRLVMALHTSQSVPTNMVVNHIDSNRSNNSVSNLEYITQQENVSKRNSLKASNTSGIEGLSWSKKYQAWRCCIARDKKTIVKTFNPLDFADSFENGLDIAKDAAINWISDKEARLTDIANIKVLDGSRLRNTNKSGIVGVRFQHIARSELGIFVAKFKNKSTSFGVMKYGYDEAFRLACEWRKQMEESTK